MMPDLSVVCGSPDWVVNWARKELKSSARPSISISITSSSANLIGTPMIGQKPNLMRTALSPIYTANTHRQRNIKIFNHEEHEDFFIFLKIFVLFVFFVVKIRVFFVV